MVHIPVKDTLFKSQAGGVKQLGINIQQIEIGSGLLTDPSELKLTEKGELASTYTIESITPDNI